MLLKPSQVPPPFPFWLQGTTGQEPWPGSQRPCGVLGLNGRLHIQLVSLPQIKRRASEALPELLHPVTPITNFEGSPSQDHSGLFGLVTNLEDLVVDDWEF